MALQCIQAVYELDIEPVHPVPDLLALLSAPSNPGASDEDKKEAERLKGCGNDHMSAGRVGLAIECYSKAIALDPSNTVFYSNRYDILSPYMLIISLELRRIRRMASSMQPSRTARPPSPSTRPSSRPTPASVPPTPPRRRRRRPRKPTLKPWTSTPPTTLPAPASRPSSPHSRRPHRLGAARVPLGG